LFILSLGNYLFQAEGYFMSDVAETDNIELDLTKGHQLNEFYDTVVMGEKIKQMLWIMFGSNSTLNPFSGVIKGTPQQIKRFAGALGAEKRYMDAFNQYGLNNARTFKSRVTLDRAVSNFERDTGIPWPFK
jgi:hypothetical protein